MSPKTTECFESEPSIYKEIKDNYVKLLKSNRKEFIKMTKKKKKKSILFLDSIKLILLNRIGSDIIVKNEFIVESGLRKSHENSCNIIRTSYLQSPFQ